MKPILNKEIEMSSKGIDYVDSLVPTDQDCINAVKYQLDDLYIRAGEIGIYTKDEKGKLVSTECGYWFKEKWVNERGYDNRKEEAIYYPEFDGTSKEPGVSIFAYNEYGPS